jgi:NADH-quinone oxidoreductase subunit L
LCGWLVARWRYGSYRAPREGRLSRFLLHGWQADAVVDFLVVRPFAAMARLCSIGCDRALVDASLEGLARQAAACGDRLRGMTTGRVSTYLAGFVWGFLIILGWLLLTLVR